MVLKNALAAICLILPMVSLANPSDQDTKTFVTRFEPQQGVTFKKVKLQRLPKPDAEGGALPVESDGDKSQAFHHAMEEAKKVVGELADDLNLDDSKYQIPRMMPSGIKVRIIEE